jgi:hypothetical protein
MRLTLIVGTRDVQFAGAARLRLGDWFGCRLRGWKGLQIGDERFFVSTTPIRSPLPGLRAVPGVRTTFISVITVAPSQPRFPTELVDPACRGRRWNCEGNGEHEEAGDAHIDPP